MDASDVLTLMRRVADSKSALAHHENRAAFVDANALSTEQSDSLQKVKSELKSVVLELEKEMALKFQAEAALQHEREMLFSSKHAKVMQLRDTEIAELEAQRDTMAQWLRRGVTEAERLSSDLVAAAADLGVAREREGDARTVVEDLTVAGRFVSDELETISKTVSSLTESTLAIRDSLRGQDSSLAEYHEAIESSAKASSGHTSDRASLKSHARRLELIEAAVSCIAASVRRADHNLSKIQSAVYSGNAETIDPADDDGFDSEADAGPNSFPPRVAAEILPRIANLSSTSTQIEVQVKTFTSDQSRRERERMDEHLRHLTATRANNAKVREECEQQIFSDRVTINEMEQEREELLSFLREQQEATVDALELMCAPAAKRLESHSVKEQDLGAVDDYDLESNYSAFTRRTTRSVAAVSSTLPPPKKLTAVEQIYELITALNADAHGLEKSNAKWLDKVSSQEDDYASVKKLRHSYRDLESTKTLLSIEIREAEHRNKELKLSILDYSDMYGMSSSLGHS